MVLKVLHLRKNTFDRKHISSIPSPNTNPNFNSSPNPKAQ